MYDAQLKQKSLSNQAAFCWSPQQICTTNVNLLPILYLEISSKIRDPNLLKRLDFACKKNHTFTHIKAWAILCMLMTLNLCPDSNAASFERLHLKIECATKAVPIQRWNASFDSWAMKDTADRSFMVQTIPRFIVCQKMLDYTFKLKY